MLNKRLISMSSTIVLVIFFVSLASIPILASSPEATNDFDLSPEEEFLFSEQEIVISAAKYEQKISQAPATIYVITAEEIQQSGLTAIPDILRMVPGIEVMTISSTQTEVNARGFNKAPANKMVVMIDGLSFYENGYNLVSWNALPIILSEIKQIEVILGPSSALYGANAFSGIIHIITKSPEESRNVHFTSSGGLKNTGSHFTQHHSLLHGGQQGEASWKLTAGYDETDRWSNKEDTLRTGKVGGEINVAPSENLHFRLFGNYVNSNNESLVEDAELVTVTSIDRYDIGLSLQWYKLEFSTTYLNSVKDSEDLTSFSLSDFADILGFPENQGTQISEYKGSQQLVTPYHFQTLDIESQYIIDPFEWAKFTVGASYRNNYSNWEGLAVSPTVNEYATFVQGVLQPFENLSITLGGRFDHYKMAGNHWSYRGSLIYTFLKDHLLRLSFGKAFRNPSLLENFMGINIDIPLPSGDPMNPIIHVLQILGDRELDPESIYTTELAYHTLLLNDRLNVQLIGFYSELKDLITLNPENILVPISIPSVPFPIPILIPSFIRYTNSEDARAIGGELSLSMQWARRIKSFINYSFEHAEFTSGSKEGRRVQNSPTHKVNCGVRLLLGRGLSSSISGHYVSPTTWEGTGIMSVMSAALLNRIEKYRLDDYFLLNARLAYSFYDNKAEFAVTGYNLLADKHQEHPFGSDIGSRLLFSLRLDF